MASLADLWESSAPVAPATAPSTAPKGKLTKEAMFGVNDLAQYVQQAETTLPDLVPGSATHTRTLNDLTQAKKALAQFQNTPVSPTAAPMASPKSSNLADIWESTEPAANVQPTTGTAEGTMGAYVPRYQAQAPDQTVQAAKPGVVGNLIGKYFQTRENLKAANAGMLNALANIPSALAQSATRLGGELIGAKEGGQELAGQIPNVPVGKLLGVEGKPAYEKAMPVLLGQAINTYGIEPVAKQLNMDPQKLGDIVNVGTAAIPFIKKPIAGIKSAIGEAGQLSKTAVPVEPTTPVAPTVTSPTKPVGVGPQYEIPASMRQGEMNPAQVSAMQAAFEAKKAALQPPSAEAGLVAPKTAAGALGASAGAMATPDATTIKQALSAATPELQNALANIPFDQTHIPTFQRHIEADSLPFPIRLTEGQATGDVIKLSNEMNRRGKDPEIAQRLNSQNGQLLENINAIRDNAAPNAYGTKKIENSQAVIDSYKAIDNEKTSSISAAYKALEDANGGQFPVDGVKLASNAEAMLGKKLKTEFLPPSIKSQLNRFASGEPMTFEQFEAMRTNLAAEIRKAERTGDGNAAAASSIVRQALEDLPLQGSAAGNLKPLADNARSLAKARFDILKKDPAYKAAVEDTVPADKFIDKFVVNGVNKNIQTMVDNLGRDSVAHQHMAAGTVNWLKDKSGIVDETGNFSQAQYNKALKQLDDVNNLREIFNSEAASQLKTLGNVARYTQAQPRGAFVNNSNTLVGAMAEKARAGVGFAAEKGLNLAVPGLQLGTSVMEMRARRAAAEESRKALELGAGTKQTGTNKLQDLGK